ncbi:MAG: phenylacetate--CoA ligase [Candidatus Bathyarchaeia archaeon]
MKLNRFWQPKIEKMSWKELERLQDRRLRSIVKHAYENSVFYRRRFKRDRIDYESIKSVADLTKLPLTTKDDLRDNYPFGLLATPLEDVVRIHTSSGTTGNPTVVLYTRRDLENWSDCIARCLTMTGVGKGDIFQVILGYGLFTGGLGFHYGAEKIGATVVPSATGNTRRQVKLMKDFGVTAFTSIPSYALYLAEVAQEQGVDVANDLSVKTISCGAEAWSEAVRKKIEDLFECSVFNSYGLSEAFGPGVAFECVMQEGLHIWADQFIVEVIDPATCERVEPEEKGEIVLTTLTREAMPLLRYRTRDIAAILDIETCECGRSHPKISWIRGRTDDMVKVRGVNIFPSQIEHVLMNEEGVGNNYQLIITEEKHMDRVKLSIETAEKIVQEETLRALREKLQRDLESTLGVNIQIELVEPRSIPRVEGKAQRVLDLRRR